MSAVESALPATLRPVPAFGTVAAPLPFDRASTVTRVTPRSTPTLERRLLWERRYVRRLRFTDTAIVVLATALTPVLQLSLIAPELLAADPWIVARIPLMTAAFWLLVLAAFHTRDLDITGSGATEYKRVAHASGLTFGILAIAFVVFQWQGIRAQLIFAAPIGLLALLIGRWSWRRWLHHQRRFGHYVSRTLVVGSHDDVSYVVRTLQRDGQLGYLVVGATVADSDDESIVVDGRAYNAVGDIESVARTAVELGADSIIIASRPDTDPQYIKRLSWELEGTAAELILSSRLADVAGPRISLRPVDGLPLIHVKIPRFEGGRLALKRTMDIAVASVALLAFLPFAIIIAAAILIEDGGPVFFSQKRIGRDGREFRILKFRSMRTDAEQQLDALLAANEGAGPLFKMKDDPRVTRVGRILRKLSLDEVPQFWNVLVGDMSIVGPRPPLPREVRAYEGTVFRRLYIKPGITGLWQVSGRSDLSWEESVRLDLRYVENWSAMNDLMIMWRTARVMVQPKGAY
ncbi:sugar transferase [Microbacterium sp. NPDC057407]|uniref:sugar transferase n=1 Tax=Microbacterium sp. NPDC057407 TaxID=3346120 RepID=UPI003671441E